MRRRRRNTISRNPPTFEVAERDYPIYEFGVNDPAVYLTRLALQCITGGRWEVFKSASHDH